jgi:multiple sugar transport system ATP-binding protein
LKTTFIYVTHDQTEAMTMGDRIAVLRDGILQQLDSPQRLYDQPANMFVASFIGSPAMNFFTARVGRENGSMIIEVPGAFHLPVPADKAAHLDAYIDREVSFGIRPEDIYDAHYTPRDVSEHAQATVNVAVIEPLGSEVYVYAERGGTEFIGRFDPRTGARTGESIEVVFNMNKMHIFDRDNEQALV